MAPGILSITSVAKNQGEDMLNRWDFFNPDDSAPVAATLAAFITDVINPYLVFANTQTVFTELLYQVVTNPLTPQQIFPITPAKIGTDSGVMAPTFVCATVRWSLGATVVLTAETPQRRVRRGGKHLGGITEDYFVGNAWTVGAIPHFEAVAEGYLGMANDGWVPCVTGHPQRARHVPGTPHVPAAPPNKYCLITGFSVNRAVGSEVSRKAGHGS
jgi:hypothetical protein